MVRAKEWDLGVSCVLDCGRGQAHIQFWLALLEIKYFNSVCRDAEIENISLTH